MKDTSINIRMNSELKKQTEIVLGQLGLNMTAVVNALFNQIVRDKAVPLKFSLDRIDLLDELYLAKAERSAGYVGRTADAVADDMERIITRVENDAKTI